MARKRANGEGSILKRKDGRYMARVTVNGQRLAFYSRSREEAAAWLAEQLAAKNRGLLVAPGKMTFGQWLETWLQEYSQPRVRPTTWEDYRIIVEKHLKPSLGEILLKDLRPEHLQKLYNEKLASGLSPRRVRLIHIVAHSALKQAVKSRLLAVNPAEATSLPQNSKKEIRVLTPEEQERLMAVLGQDDLGTAILLDLWAGLRRGELLGLKWEDVDFKAGTLHIRRSLVRAPSPKQEGRKTQLCFLQPKTEKSKRVIPIPPTVLSALKAHKRRQAERRLQAGELWEDNDLVFCGPTGRPLDPSYFTYCFHELLKKAGIPRINFHALRHTFATRLLELGESPKLLQEMLGHSQISTTFDVYAHVLPELKQAAAQKMEELLQKMKKRPNQS
jgi:integrase